MEHSFSIHPPQGSLKLAPQTAISVNTRDKAKTQQTMQDLSIHPTYTCLAFRTLQMRQELVIPACPFFPVTAEQHPHGNQQGREGDPGELVKCKK